MSDQGTFFYASNERFRLSQTRQIQLAQELRQAAIRLKIETARGGYDDDHLVRFWGIISRAPNVLLTPPRNLSERASLGPSYFTEVVKARRNPKLHNFLSALTAVIDVANERLADVEDDGGLPTSWVPNPFAPETLARLQADLTSLIGHLKTSNSLTEVPGIDEVYKKQLIILLETTLQLLKAPLVERSMLARTGVALVDFGKEIAGDARVGFIGGLTMVAAELLLKSIGVPVP